MALGAAVMPALVHWWGLRAALAVVGLGVALVALAGLPRMRSLDQRLRRPAGADLARGDPDVRAAHAGRRRVACPQPDPGLRPAGRSWSARATTRTGSTSSSPVWSRSPRTVRVLRQEDAGDFFGEIGLLRDVPRTATITAVEDTVLLALERADFLDAVTGQTESRMAADDIVSRRLTV